jgi:hypothetical protein
MYDAQLEMSFSGTGNYVTRRQRRLNRAQWWFQRMRQIVDRAVDWQPTPPPRPEQIWFPGSYRPPALPPQIAAAKPPRTMEEREVCA